MCLIALVVTVAYVGAAIWLVSRAKQATQKARQREALIAQQEEALRRAQRQLETVLEYEAHRPLPEPIRSVALSYASKARN